MQHPHNHLQGRAMSFADPSSVTVGGVATTLPRTSTGPNSGTYSSSDGGIVMTVSHSYGKRNRRTIRLTQNKMVTDPLIPSQNKPTSMSCYVVVDTPLNGLSVVDQKALVDALAAYLTASSGARVTQLLGGEN